jgi:hypothetical protein
LLHHLKLPHLTAQRFQTFAQPSNPQLSHPIFLAIGRVEHSQIPRDAGIHLFHPQADSTGGVILVPGVHRLEAAAIHRHRRAADQADPAA